MKTIIQFPHPGSEHNAKTGSNWNTGSHKRKYLKVKGSYLKDLTSNPIDDTVCFWGEWEATANVIPTENQSPMPKYIFEPYCQLPLGTSNTDPFVFGNQFYYCYCKQTHYPSLRKLDVGDIILFGSNLDKYFVIDTVFVIKDWQEYSENTINRVKSNYNEVFYNVSLASNDPKCGEVKDNNYACSQNSDEKNNVCNTQKNAETYRIYSAVMYKDREKFNGIFSYSPCLPQPKEIKGFARPIVTSACITQRLKRGLKIDKKQDITDVWNEITQQVLKQRLCLMINNTLPQIVPNS